MNRKKQRTQRPSGTFINKATREDIRKEARAFGLSTSEYLQLSTDLTRLLRESIPGSDRIGAKEWMNVVNHPIVGIAMKSLSALIANREKSEDDGLEPNEMSQENASPSIPEPRQAQEPNRPQIPPEFWYM